MISDQSLLLSTTVLNDISYKEWFWIQKGVYGVSSNTSEDV